MPYDEMLAQRVRTILDDRKEVTEKRMFGGICYMLNGNMLCGVEKTALMLRVGKDAYEDALAQPHCRVMDFTGRPMAGYVNVDLAGIADKRSLKRWLERAEAYVSTLPAKVKKVKPPLRKSK